MERKTHRFDRGRGTGALDPIFERAAFLVELEQQELVAVIPQAEAGPGMFRY